MSAPQTEERQQPARPTSELQRLSIDEQTNVLLKFIPEDQPSPRAWLELVKTQVMGVDARGLARPIEDLVFFLQVCRRAGLDPLARQIYAVYRWDTRLGREKMSIQVSIDGIRLNAHRTGLYGGQDDVVFTPADESADHPVKAAVTVYRLNPQTGERMPVTASARWNEYVPLGRDGNPTGMWNRMPYLMLAKVAEALALRKAFPQELSGLYAGEELDQDGDELGTRQRVQLQQSQADGERARKAPVTAAQVEERKAQVTEIRGDAKAVEQQYDPQPEYKTAARPWTPEQLRAALHAAELANQKTGATPNGSYKAAIGGMEKIAGVAGRKLFGRYCFGVESFKEMSPAAQAAIGQWAKFWVEPDSKDWLPGPHFQAEFEAVVYAPK